MYQRYVYKIHSKEIIKSQLSFNLTVSDARKKQELITLADSQILRFIDDINKTNREENNLAYKRLHKELKLIRKGERQSDTKVKINNIYKKLEKIQIVNEYLCVIIDKPDDMEVLSQGFSFNGRHFKRLVGTPNGVKKSIVIYTSIWEQLNERMNCGRDTTKEIVPAKFEAYKSLVCSSSIPLSDPKGVVVVSDLELEFMSHVLEISDSDIAGGDPKIQEKDTLIRLNANDGFGLISPALSERWSNDLDLSYRMSGCCLRNAFVKGMVYTFDFHEFAKEIAKTDIIIDVWGNEHNINDIELILTVSMAKLWDSYSSYEDYEKWFKHYGYTYAATKVTPKYLDNERTLNYQFIQSYDLTDEQIYELISPTVNEIKSVLHEDIDKTILFLRGMSVTDDNVLNDLNDDYVKALMIDKRMINDPYVIDRINLMIKKKINDAKIGVINVHGNYQVLSGDPYALCQYMFGLLKEQEDYDNCGLLKAGEVYSHYWVKESVDKVVTFRAPMSSHSNIKVVSVVNNPDVAKWYQYMSEVFIINAHDTLTHSWNGADNDGDLVYSTNNHILLNNTRDTLPIVCVQKKAEKKVITEELLARADSNGFGNSIGAITNRITAMYDVQAQFDKRSKEYQVLEDRIKCGQLYQQNEIDKIKGIISDPMPKSWYVYEDCKTDFEKSICACKKSYFMNYIYAEQMTNYKSYIKDSVVCGIFDYGKGKTIVDDLLRKTKLTPQQQSFVDNYIKYFPVFDEQSTMNRLCHMVENEFDGYVPQIKRTSDFNSSILKSGAEYSRKDYNAIKKLYLQFNHEIQQLKTKYKKISKEETQNYEDSIEALSKEFLKECILVCPNQDSMCNIMVDLCYSSNAAKSFVWRLCGDIIIDHLLAINDYQLTYLVKNEFGDIIYRGLRFSKQTMLMRKED